MSGSLLNSVRKDALKYATKGGFEEDITLTTPDSNTVLNLKGLATKHWINFDTDGAPVNSKNAHICIPESDLEIASYPARRNGEVYLRNHLVSVKDSTGVLKNYVIKEWFPNETLGFNCLHIR
jgi:hypothetical protein